MERNNQDMAVEISNGDIALLIGAVIISPLIVGLTLYYGIHGICDVIDLLKEVL